MWTYGKAGVRSGEHGLMWSASVPMKWIPNKAKAYTDNEVSMLHAGTWGAIYKGYERLLCNQRFSDRSKGLKGHLEKSKAIISKSIVIRMVS